MKVLLVDDESDILEQSKAFLTNEKDSFEIETTVSPKKALKMLEKNNFDAAVSDYKMPEMDGLELLKTLRNEKDINIPFIIFTGKGREEVAMEALNLGADRYIRKGGEPRAQYGVMADAIEQEVKNHRRDKDLKKSKIETQMLLDNFPTMFFLLDKEGRIVRANQTFSDYLGIPKDKLEGELLEEVFPEEQTDKMMEDIQEIIESGNPKRNTTEPFYTSEGTSWVRADKLPMEGEDGDVDGIIVFARDITETKEAQEKEKFLHSLLRHDMKNKIQVIQGYHRLIEKADLSKKHRNYLKKAEKTAKESQDLIDKIRTLREVKNEDIDKTDVEPLLKGAIKQKKEMAREEGINLVCNDSECEVIGGSLLEELFSNIIENSVRHSGCNEIRISTQETDGEYIIIVEDDGEGIPDEDKEKIFEKGFKKGEKEGSGLGMHIVKKIAETYDGRVEVKDSELGGARFDIRLKTP